MEKRPQRCPFRHENGNCLCVGGFCTAVALEICKAVRSAYNKGVSDGVEQTKTFYMIERDWLFR